jgi:hypothetical protein
MSIAYLFLVLVFLILHPPSWSYSMQVGSIRILRKATYKKLGTHKKMISYITYSTIVQALQRRVGPGTTRRQQQETPQKILHAWKMKKNYVLLLILFSNYYFNNIFIASMI